MRFACAGGTNKTLSRISHLLLPRTLHRIFTVPIPNGVVEVSTLLSGGPQYFSPWTYLEHQLTTPFLTQPSEAMAYNLTHYMDKVDLFLLSTQLQRPNLPVDAYIHRPIRHTHYIEYQWCACDVCRLTKDHLRNRTSLHWTRRMEANEIGELVRAISAMMNL